MNLPNELITPASLITLSGASLVVYLTTSVLGYAFDVKTKKWFGLIPSLVLACFIAFYAQSFPGTVVTWFIIFVNTLQIYVTAVGANVIQAPAPEKAKKRGMDIMVVNKKSKKRRKFRELWW